jgi:hypothetical protein
MGMEYRYGLMARSTKGISEMERDAAEEDSSKLKVMSMMV